MTRHAVLDRGAWARSWPGLGGAAFHLTNALRRLSFHIDFVGPLEEERVLFSGLKSLVYGRVLRRRYYPWAEESVFRGYARQVAGELAKLGADVVFCPENAMPIAYLECRQPIVLWTDAPLAALIDSYDYLRRLCGETRADLRRMEAAALRRCARVLYSSEWAAEAALRHYAVDPAKLIVVPWGANLEREPPAEEIRVAVERRAPRPCKLLFLGMWWARKGGDKAVAVAEHLNSIGVPATLTIVGCEPTAAAPRPSFVDVLGFLDKSTREGGERFERVLAESHFLILPSRADCTPLVVGEANAFGVPCLASDVGGISTLVKNGSNGRLFSPEASPAEYAEYISSLMRDSEAYQALALSSAREYETRLNWNATARAVRDVLEGLA